ncbi:MAG: hypothetical protein Q8P67_04325 [archaeon]|nr:hypothetical protein [archaeon]
MRHTFTSKQSDWGFRDFIQKHNPAETRHLLKDDILILDVSVETHSQSVQPNPSIDQNFPGATKTLKESGYAGPQSSVSTQYLNSALMVLFHLAFFRRALYSIDTAGDATSATPRVNLQCIFHQLQEARTSGIDQSQLVLSLAPRWPHYDSWNSQHDCRAFFPHLFESLFAMPQLPEIRHLFLDLDLAKALPSSSSSNAAAASPLPGNSVQAALLEHAVDTEGGAPPVLFVHLNRFLVNANGLKSKATGFFDYDGVLAFGRADYQLHAVLVHNGAVHGGHYHCFIRPTTDPRWFKFDDELVFQVENDAVFEDNFGGRGTVTSHAYLLVYVHSAHVADGSAISPLAETPIPQQLQTRFQQGADDDRRRHLERAETLLYMDVRIATIEALSSHDPAKPDLVDFETVPRFHIRKASTLRELKAAAAQQFGVPPDHQKYWSWYSRENGTFRPHEPIVARLGDDSMLYDITTASVWDLLLESTPPHSLAQPSSPPERVAFLLLKYFDCAAEQIRLVGSVSVDRHLQSVRDLIPLCLNAARLPLSQELELFEEVNPNLVLDLQPRQTIEAAELQTGDVIVFQKAGAAVHCRDWYRQLSDRIDVSFVPLPNSPHAQGSSSGPFALSLEGSISYGAVVARASSLLGVEPDFLRLTGHNPILGIPRSLPHLPSHDHCLRDLLCYHYDPISPTLYFEVIPFSMADYEEHASIRVEWQLSGKRYEVLIPKSSTVRRVLSSLRDHCPEAALHPEDRLSLSPISPQSNLSSPPLCPKLAVANMNSFLHYRADLQKN